MISSQDRERLQDMATYDGHAVDLLGDLNPAELQLDIRTQFAVIRAIEIVGEAASKVSDDIRTLLPNTPWKAIVGMRNALIHGYQDVQLARVVNVVKDRLPALISEIGSLLSKDKQS